MQYPTDLHSPTPQNATISLFKAIYFGANCEVGTTYTYVLVFTIHMPYIFNTHVFPAQNRGTEITAPKKTG
jgi:hypothetical protein